MSNENLRSDILNKISELLEREKEYYQEAHRLSGSDCAGAAMAMGAIDTLMELKVYLEEDYTTSANE